MEMAFWKDYQIAMTHLYALDALGTEDTAIEFEIVKAWVIQEELPINLRLANSVMKSGSSALAHKENDRLRCTRYKKWGI